MIFMIFGKGEFFLMIMNELNMRKVLKLTMIIFLPAAILLSATIIMIHQFEEKGDLRLIMDHENGQIKMLTKVMANDFELVVRDMLYLSRFIRPESLFGIDGKRVREVLGEDFLSFCEEKKIYDQIRYIDDHGQELTRVNYNNGQPLIVPQDQLQLKLESYYFEEIYQLDSREVFISPFDLNIEFDSVELPLKPMIRFGTPVFNDKRQKKGILIFNYFGNTILRNIKRLSSDNMGEIMLMNTEGYWLMSSNSDDEWGFMFKERKDITMENRFPKIWQIMTSDTSGQSRDQRGLLTFGTIYPFQGSWISSEGSGRAYGQSSDKIQGTERFWKIASFIPNDKLESQLREDVIGLQILNGILLILTFIVSGILANSTIRRKMTNENIRQSEKMYKILSGQLKESNSIKELLLDVITHDIKNTAGVISGISEIVLEESPDSEKIEVIKTCSENLLNIIENATALSQATIGEEIEKKEINLTEVIQMVLKEFSAQLEASEMKLKLDIQDKLIVKANPIITEVFKNYISNAIKYASSGKKILISNEESDSSVTINVIDFGETLPESKRQAVFIRSVQLEEGKKRGRGLGLSIVKKIGEVHNAEVGVKPNKPKGNIFYIKIPKK